MVSKRMRRISEEDQKSLVRRLTRKVGLALQPEVVAGFVGSDDISSTGSIPMRAATLPEVQSESRLLVRMSGNRELLSQVLAFMGEGTEIAAMLVCKDMCKYVRLSRGWQENIGKKKTKMCDNCS